MDVTPYLDILPAPRVVFERIEWDPTLRDVPRFYRGASDGSWEPVTWGTFADQIRNVALCLHDAGLVAGERAAIYAPNRVSWMSAALGIQAARGVMVPIYPASTAEQLAYIVNHSDAKVLFVGTAALLERALAVRDRCPMLERIIVLDEEEPAGVREHRTAAPTPPSSRAAGLATHPMDWPEVMAAGDAAHARAPHLIRELLDGIDLNAPGLMLYTSGTSGHPKGVPLTHDNVGTNGRDWLLSNAALLEEDMVDLLWLPMSHIFGLGEVCQGNALGFTTYLTSPQEVLARLPEVRPSVFMSVPAYWEKIALAAQQGGTSRASRPSRPSREEREERCARLQQITGGRLRFCLSGGAGLKREVKELFHDCGLLIIEGYGLTETSPTLTLNRPDDFRFDTVGKPLPSLELRLAADGEILARGPNVFSGYHKDPEATAGCFTDDGWFCTGDVGRFTEDGFLQIIDRKKDILVTAGGKNIPPTNIELRFRDDPLIENLVVYGDGKKYLVAGVWIDAAAAARELGTKTPSAAQLEALVQARIDRVNAELARHETIKRFCIMDVPLTVESGYLTTSLKLRRKHVYQAFSSQLESLYES